MKNSTLFISVILILSYAVDVFFCLLSIKRKDRKMYIITKSLLMPLLLLSYLSFFLHQNRMLHIQRFCILALILHCMGDVFLLFPKSKGQKIMFAGVLSFFLGHISYTLWFANLGLELSKKFALITLIFMMIIEYFLYRQVMLTSSRKFAPLVCLYSFGLVSLSVAIASLFGSTERWYAPLISLIGVFLFYFSDYCVARRVARMPLFGQMVVMSTYISAQTLIILGMILIQL